MHHDDQEQVSQVRNQLARDTLSKQGFAKEYFAFVSKVRSKSSLGSGRGSKAREAVVQEQHLKRGPMFTGGTSATDVAAYLPPLYKVRADDFNGRWEVTHQHRYIVSISWMRWGFAEGAKKACETCWADHHRLRGQACPWIVAAAAEAARGSAAAEAARGSAAASSSSPASGIAAASSIAAGPQDGDKPRTRRKKVVQ